MSVFCRKKNENRKKKRKSWPAGQTRPAPLQPVGYAGRVMRVKFFLRIENINPSRQKVRVMQVQPVLPSLPESPIQLCLVAIVVVAASISQYSGPLPIQLCLLLHLSLSNITNGERNGMPMVNGTCSFFSCVTHSIASLLWCVVFDRYIKKTKSQPMTYIKYGKPRSRGGNRLGQVGLSS